MDTLYIVMPAYNEEANIEKVVKDWYSVLDSKSESSRLVVADSGSIDNTHSILLLLQKELLKLEILPNTGKQHGPKIIELYNYAIKNGADYIFQTDSDGQTDPDEFPAFWNERTVYDGIFGNRTTRQDGKSRALVERAVCLLVRGFFGVNVPDANAPFRLMRAKCVEQYLNRLPEDYNIPNIMITTYFAFYREKIKFEKISFKPRQGGKNSIDLFKIVKIGCKALKDFAIFRKDMKRHELRKVQ